MKKIKLLLDARMLGSSGIGVYIAELIHELHERKIEITAIINIDQLSTTIPCKTIATPLDRYNPLNSLFLYKLMSNFDIFFAPNLAFPPLRRLGKKYFCTCHDMCPVRLPKIFGNKKAIAYWALSLIQFTTSNKIFCVSEFTKNEVSDIYSSLFDKKTICAPNGCKSLPKVSEHFLNDVNAKYGICVGNIKPHKNTLALAGFFENTATNFKLIIIGKSSGFLTGEKTTKIQNTDKVIFKGEASENELAQLYRNASFFISPSLYEGFGLPLLEAMKYSLPLILSDIAPFREIASNKAFYFNPYDFTKLEEHLKKIEKAPIYNYTDILDKYTWSNCAQTIIEEFIKSYSEFKK